MRRLLEFRGHTVVEATDGANCLDVYATAGPVDVILIDYNMCVKRFLIISFSGMFFALTDVSFFTFLPPYLQARDGWRNGHEKIERVGLQIVNCWLHGTHIGG